MKLKIRRRLLPFAPALLVVLVGCASEATPEPVAPVAAVEPAKPATPEPAVVTPPADDVAEATTVSDDPADDSMSDLREYHFHHHHGGFPSFISLSVETLGTTPQQDAAIKKIQADLRARLKPARDAEKEVLTQLADGVAAGKVNQVKIDAAIAKLQVASGASHDAIADALNQLHDALTAEQRAALVGKVEANYEVWQRQNSSDESADAAHGGNLSKLASAVSLSMDQVNKIRSSFNGSMAKAHFDNVEADGHMKALGGAFVGEKFDAKGLPGGATNDHMAGWGLTRTSHLYAAATPILTKEQRAKVSDLLRRDATYDATLPGEVK